MDWIGVDIGGANLKAATDDGVCHTRPFPMWSAKDRLAAELAELLDELLVGHTGRSPSLAVTMTGELADGFDDRRQGVHFLIDAAEQAGAMHGIDERLYFATNGKLMPAANAKTQWQTVASANWAAMARYLATRFEHTKQIWIDLGSTTTDIIPVSKALDGVTGWTDQARLASGELVYVGASRTPVSMLVGSLNIDQQPTGVARELFATIADAFLVLGHCYDGKHETPMADGRPPELPFARQRLARTICTDASLLSDQELQSMASQILAAAKSKIMEGLAAVAKRSPSFCERFVVSGSGESFAAGLVATQFPAAEIVRLSHLLGPDTSEVGPAYAVARLAGQHDDA